MAKVIGNTPRPSRGGEFVADLLTGFVEKWIPHHKTKIGSSLLAFALSYPFLSAGFGLPDIDQGVIGILFAAGTTLFGVGVRHAIDKNGTVR